MFKIRHTYMTKPVPSCGVPSEAVKVLGREAILGEIWLRVRYSDGGVVMMHPSQLLEA